MTDVATVAVVDGHVHFWDQSRLTYPWLDGFDEIAGPYVPSLVPAQVGVATVERLVFVQADCVADQGFEEVEWVTSLAESDERIGAIVAFAPLEAPGVAPVLERLQASPLVRGVRRLIQGERPGFCTEIVDGVRLLAAYDLSFDICVSEEQLPEVLELVDAAPETRFVLDHVGKPKIKEAQWSPWAENIAALARHANVWCKLSGMVTEADPGHWSEADLAPYARHVLESFGSDRVMFGSDWPVVNLAGGYEAWINAAQSMVLGGGWDVEAVFSGTARSFYGLASTNDSNG